MEPSHGHVFSKYPKNTSNIKYVLFLKLLKKIVKKSRGDPGENGAKPEVLLL